MSLKALVLVAQSFSVLQFTVFDAAPVVESSGAAGHAPAHTNNLRKAHKKVTPTKPFYWATGPPT
ncbi:MAG TPA: hypothetical protein VN665_01390 [Candidatus Paceibacterota bacterium]|nr:hypothetical protein [Candidatus Paceibacterota bacterium]